METHRETYTDNIEMAVMRSINEQLREGYGLHSALSLINRKLDDLLVKVSRIEEKLDEDD